jgi:hypothetical protein
LEETLAPEFAVILEGAIIDGIRRGRDRFNQDRFRDLPRASIQKAARAVVEAELRSWSWGRLVYAEQLRRRRLARPEGTEK